MEKKTKSILMMAVVVILSVMFVLGNIGGNNSTPPTKSATTTITPTLLVTGTANAIVMGYSRNMVIYGSGSSNSLLGELNTLQKDGNINSYTRVGNQIDVNGSNFSSYQIYNSISVYSPNLTFNTTAYVTLPNPVMLKYSGNLVRIDIGNSTYDLHVSSLVQIGSRLPVSVQAIVTEQGVLYKNQLRLAELG